MYTTTCHCINVRAAMMVVGFLMFIVGQASGLEELDLRTRVAVNISVPIGTDVKFICGNPYDAEVIDWMKDTLVFAACHRKDNLQLWDFSDRLLNIEHDCDSNQQITIRRIQKSHNGSWFCRYSNRSDKNNQKLTAGVNLKIADKTSVPTRSENDTENNNLNNQNTIYGVTAGMLALVLVVVVAVICKLRNKDNAKRKDSSGRQNDDEESVTVDNPVYETSDVPLCDNEHSDMNNHHLQIGVQYTANDGMYSEISADPKRTITQQQTDVYTQVQKSNGSTTQTTDVYTQVKKPKQPIATSTDVNTEIKKPNRPNVTKTDVNDYAEIDIN